MPDSLTVTLLANQLDVSSAEKLAKRTRSSLCDSQPPKSPDAVTASVEAEAADAEAEEVGGEVGEGWASARHRQVTCGLMIVSIARLLQRRSG